jgi:thiol-disulfide isomerase/thioredoxin
MQYLEVNTLGPAVPSQDEEIGFTTAIGQFNTLIDTIANERSGSLSTDGSSVIQLLSTRHGCNTYISTLSKSQSIVKKEGVIFGPGKANAHVKALESKASSKCMSMIPSSGFGEMLQILLNSKVIYPSKSNKAIVTRGWSMKEFWEETSWPRDSNGSGVRFGMPVVEENDLDEVFRRERLALQRRRIVDDDEEEDDGAVAVQVKVEENPYVTQIVGTDGLAEAIINQRKSSVVFVSMRSCRTCKTINPVYTKIAREYEGDVMFAKADATGRVGKALGKSLGLISVPSFVLFRNGVRYGAVQTSKLPSDRLQKAINDLESGRDFDPACEVGDDD